MHPIKIKLTNLLVKYKLRIKCLGWVINPLISRTVYVWFSKRLPGHCCRAAVLRCATQRFLYHQLQSTNPREVKLDNGNDCCLSQRPALLLVKFNFQCCHNIYCRTEIKYIYHQNPMLGGVPVPTAWHVLGLRMEELPPAMEVSCEYIE
jgi:hypothetical protein